MISKKYGVGIVGTGWTADYHVKSFTKNKNTEIVAVCHYKIEKAEIFIKEHNLSNAIAYDNYEKMLEQDNLDIVSICTPSHLHVEEGVLAAKAKKHIFLEKPVALELEGLYLLQDEINKAKIKSMVSFGFRGTPLLNIIKDTVDSGSIGKIFYSEVDYRSATLADKYYGFKWIKKKSMGGSSFLLAGCHAIDAMRWIIGQEASEVYAYSGGWDKRYEFDPTCVALIKFKDGTIGKSLSSHELNIPYFYDMNLELYGDEGTIRNNKLYSPKLFKGQTGFSEIPCTTLDDPEAKFYLFDPLIDYYT